MQNRQDDQLAQYLLGTMPEAEELRLEAEYLADADVQERLAIMEDELVDAYVRNQLPRADGEKLEARFLASPRGKQKLALARSLLALTEQARVSRRSAHRRWLGFAAVAAVAALIALVMLQRGGWRRPTEIQRTAGEPREATPRAPTSNDPPRIPPVAKEPPPVAFAILQPGLSRGAGAPDRVHIPAGAAELTLELDLEVDRHPMYRVELLGASEQVRWRARGLKSRRGHNGKRAIVLQLPVTLFRNVEYTIILSPDEAGATAVAQFGFAVRLD